MHAERGIANTAAESIQTPTAISRPTWPSKGKLMHKEQQDDNKTKEIRIIQDNGIWKVINHEGRTLDATRTRAEAEESVAILEQFPEYRGRWP